MDLDVVDYAEHALGAGKDATAVSYVETRSGDGNSALGRWHRSEHHDGITSRGGVGVHASPRRALGVVRPEDRPRTAKPVVKDRVSYAKAKLYYQSNGDLQGMGVV